MRTDKIRRLLRENGTRVDKVLNAASLKKGLEAVIKAYDEKGYALIGIGDVLPAAGLSLLLRRQPGPTAGSDAGFGPARLDSHRAAPRRCPRRAHRDRARGSRFAFARRRQLDARRDPLRPNRKLRPPRGD